MYDQKGINWAEVKEKNPIQDVFEHIFGLRPVTRSYDFLKYRCPWHADRGPSLAIWPREGRMTDFGGCEICGRRSADVIDLMCHVYNISRVEAAIRLGAEQYERKPVELVAPTHNEGLDTKWVEWGYRNWRQAAQVLTPRGITVESIQKWQIGYWPHYKTGIRYQLLDDTEFERLPCPRVGIPHMISGNLRYINLRLDMRAAQERIEMSRSTPGFAAVVETVKESLKPGQAFEDELAYALFGDKYLFMKGSRQYNTIFNGGDLLNTDNDAVTYPYLELAAAHEGELDTITTRQELGVPSIGTKGSDYLAQATRNVELLLIVKDNDKTRPNAQGKMINPGQEHAKRTLRTSGRIPGFNALIVSPFPEFKDCNAMQQAGVLRDWWDSLHLGTRSLTRKVIL